jgi:hypothetical protein
MNASEKFPVAGSFISAAYRMFYVIFTAGL